jgi:hypothetical protein
VKRSHGRVAGACALLLIAAAVAAVTATPAWGAAKRCGSIPRMGEAGPELVRVRATNVTCRVARRTLAHQRRAVRRGWDCSSAGSEAVCTRGARRAVYGPGPSVRVRECGNAFGTPNTDAGIFGIQALRTRCRVARAVARPAVDIDLVTGKRRYRSRRYRCSGVFDDTTLPQVHWFCVRGTRAVAFVQG